MKQARAISNYLLREPLITPTLSATFVLLVFIGIRLVWWLKSIDAAEVVIALADTTAGLGLWACVLLIPAANFVNGIYCLIRLAAHAVSKKEKVIVRDFLLGIVLSLGMITWSGYYFKDLQ